jgi:hypothetical protein
MEREQKRIGECEKLTRSPEIHGSGFGCRAAIAAAGEFCQNRNRMKTAIISIDNLKSDDLPALRQAFDALPGVDSVDFSIERSVAVIEFDPAQSHIDDFLRAALKAGFRVQ